MRAALAALAALAAVTACAPASLPAQAKSAAAPARASLAQRLDARLDAAPFGRQLWGVALVDESGTLLYGRDADRMFIPASNTKLVVTAVAAALLDPATTVKTSVYAAGPVDGGVLQGDLVLYGRGDPAFAKRCYAVDTTAPGVCDTDPMAKLRQLAEGLRQKGVRAVQGDVVGDGSYFEPMIVHPGWEVYDVNWWYAAPVSGLGFNDNSLDITYAPAATLGAPAVLAFTPDFGSVQLENRTVTVPPAMRETIDFYRVPATSHVWAEGTVAQGGKPTTQYFAVEDPNRFAAEALRAALQQAGIAVLGTVRSTTDSMLYAPARRTPPLAEVESRPVRDWIFPILNTSQNWVAEMLLKQLGKRFGKAGSWDEGLAVERRFLIDSVKADSTQFALSDGSGLSSSNLISPLTFTKLLQFMRRHPHYQAWAAGLPQSGKRGSLQKRFVATPLEGRVRAKTGSIARVNTLSGYIERPDGRVLTFSVQANHHTLPSRTILAQIDSVVVEMGK
ncbi:MAG TPA: D-alanyl-D-alanine carboxypeptidase/D-alanyl-D-alanine-endopeptidase [Gemmatimonadales bacterium]|nr:D-alanyl-D-alanine carboxypeptidase/D-alanyl-D-alanine-endopeptidase [Gemmatimonadales bacterium]